MELKDLAVKASHILEVVENYQWELGSLANEVIDQYGYKRLEEFSKEIENISGVKRSPGTLRMYAYVWKVSNQLGLPKDILYSTCQSIVFSDDPQKYAKMAKEGYSRIDIRKAIYND